MSGIIIPDGGTIGSASDADAISIASDGKATLSQKATFSQGIANTGTIDAGTIGSGVTIQQKTAVITGENSADFNPVDDGSYLYTVKLNTELDPYNFVTLSSNTVTVTESGTYNIFWSTGKLLGYNETGTSSYIQSYLEKGGTKIKQGETAILLDLYDRTGTTGSQVDCEGSWLGTLSANDTLKIRIETHTADFEPYSWTAFTGSGKNNVWGRMIIHKIG